MAITQENWLRIRPKLVPGCTFFYDSAKGTLNEDLLVNFDDPTYSKGWFLTTFGEFSRHQQQMSDFRFPDGQLMIDVKLDNQNKIQAKFKKIEARHLKTTSKQTEPRVNTIISGSQAGVTMAFSLASYTTSYNVQRYQQPVQEAMQRQSRSFRNNIP